MFLNIIMVVLSVLEVLCAILLMAIILLQKSRSHGAAAGLAFGAGMGESLFGSQATTVLTKITVVLTAFFLVNTTILAVLGSRERAAGTGRSVMDGVPSAPPPIESMIPGGPMGGQPPAGGMPVPMPAAPPVQDVAMPVSGVAGEPVKIETPAPAPAPAQAPAPAPAPENNAGDKPAQP